MGTDRFWRDLLGMRLVAGVGEPGYRHYFFEISETDLITFFEWPDIQPIKPKEHSQPVKGPFVFDHVSFGLESLEDLWELKDKLDVARPKRHIYPGAGSELFHGKKKERR